MVKAQSSKLNVNCSLFATFRASRLRTAIFSSGMHCKVTKFLVGFQILPLCASTYVNLCELMSTYARYLDVFLAKRSFILYLCGAFNQYYLSIMFITNHYDQNTNQSSAIGRMELAQSYFPFLLPRSAWQKFKRLLRENPDLSGFAKQRRRTFLPSEVDTIYHHLGRP